MKLTKEKRQRILNWDALPKKERPSLALLSKDLSVSRVTIYNVLKHKPQTVEGDYDSNEYLVGRTKAADEALLVAVQAGNAQAIRTYYQLLNRLTDKSEVTHKVDGNFFARASNEAERELRDEGYRVAGERVDEVQKKLPLLPPELCEATGQEQGKDS